MVDMLLVLEEILELDELPVFLEDVLGALEDTEDDGFIHETERERREDIVDAFRLEELRGFLRSDGVDHDSIFPFVLELELLDEMRIDLEDADLRSGSNLLQECIRKSTAPRPEFHDMDVVREVYGTDHLLV